VVESREGSGLSSDCNHFSWQEMKIERKKKEKIKKKKRKKKKSLLKNKFDDSK